MIFRGILSLSVALWARDPLLFTIMTFLPKELTFSPWQQAMKAFTFNFPMISIRVNSTSC